jgi:hypothetical protein
VSTLGDDAQRETERERTKNVRAEDDDEPLIASILSGRRRADWRKARICQCQEEREEEERLSGLPGGLI